MYGAQIHSKYWIIVMSKQGIRDAEQQDFSRSPASDALRNTALQTEWNCNVKRVPQTSATKYIVSHSSQKHLKYTKLYCSMASDLRDSHHKLSGCFKCKVFIICHIKHTQGRDFGQSNHHQIKAQAQMHHSYTKTRNFYTSRDQSDVQISTNEAIANIRNANSQHFPTSLATKILWHNWTNPTT